MSRLRARLNRRQREREIEESVRRALGESTGSTSSTPPVSTAGGDPQVLRGIPAIGRGVGGAVRGTQPEREAMRRVRDDSRDPRYPGDE